MGEVVPIDLFRAPLPEGSSDDIDLELEDLVANVQILGVASAPEPAITFEQREAQRIADRQAVFGDIVDITHSKIYGLVLKLCNYEEDTASEVTQDTYLRAWRYINSFRGDSKVTTWLYTIAVNAAKDSATTRERIRAVTELAFIGHHKHWRPTSDRDESAQPTVEDLPDTRSEDALHAVEVRQDLSEPIRKALAGLSIKLRQVVILHAVERYRHPEVAEILGIDEITSKVRFHRAIKRLRLNLGTTFESWSDDTA